MNADEIVKEAKARLAVLDAERAKLIALIAASEGKAQPMLPLPPPEPYRFIPALPYQPAFPHVPPQEIPWHPGPNPLFPFGDQVYCIGVDAARGELRLQQLL